jgi:pimeloyl-ACP methyl ester carboxylesterase
MPQTAADQRDDEPSAAGDSLFVTAQDGLRLHVRAYGPPTVPACRSGMFPASAILESGRAQVDPKGRTLPVVCLPGLARTTADFDTLAVALATDRERPRRVFAVDYRGRGKSDYDRKPANYNLNVELADILSVLTALEIVRAVFIGTSRGGILSMLLASARPTAMAGCILNDIGPVIEPKGLMRIKSYVGRLPRPASFHEAAEILRRLFGSQFPRWDDDDWVAFARRTFKEAGARIVPDYDVRLATTLRGINPDRPPPTMWKEFDALGRVPVMAIRGANSDILAPATVDAMRSRHRDLEVIEVPDEGHAPRLSEAGMLARIAGFVASCETVGRH